jgi:hypothetical protein
MIRAFLRQGAGEIAAASLQVLRAIFVHQITTVSVLTRLLHLHPWKQLISF